MFPAIAVYEQTALCIIIYSQGQSKSQKKIILDFVSNAFFLNVIEISLSELNFCFLYGFGCPS